MKVITDSRCTDYEMRGHPERPERISRSVEKLTAQRSVPIEWVEALEVQETSLLRAHTQQHLNAVADPMTDFDPDTPAYPDIHQHARRSVGGALAALKLAAERKAVFSLLRPPGHHATKERAMGFCYFNSIAIAVLEALESGFNKVAVFDFDVHHGNGTEAILLNQPGTEFYSIHQFPAFPGTGAKPIANCFNYPVPPGETREAYRKTLETAFEKLLQFEPDLIAVSAGFDAYTDDPLSEEPLVAQDYYWLGELIRRTGIPSFSLLEGGYSDALPDLILAYLRGLEGAQE